MNEREPRESLPVPGGPPIGKIPPRLIRVLSGDSNLQTISLAANSDNDSLATISLAEIGGIPQCSGTTTRLDPNLLIRLSPETLNVMTTNFQFLTSSCPDLPPSSITELPSTSVGDLEPLTRSSTGTDACTTSITDTHPVPVCLSSYSAGGVTVSKSGECSSAIPLTADGTSSDPEVSGIISSSTVTTSPPSVTAISCSLLNADVASSPRTQSTTNPENCGGIRILSSAVVIPETQRLGDVKGYRPQVSPNGSSMPEQFLNDSQPGTSQDGIGSTSPTPEAHKPHTPTTPSSILGETVSRVGIHESPEDPEDQSSLLDSSASTVQYVSITVPNVAINSSGQLVISHVSLLQAPQSNSFIPLVTQSVASPVVSQTATPDSTSEGNAPLKKKRKGGWPKGKKRTVRSPDLKIPKTTPTTSYMIYFKDNRERIQRENPGVTFQELKKLIGSSWATLTEDEKQVYTNKAAKLKKQYLSEVKSHSQTDAYQTLLRKEAVKKMKNNEGDFPGSDDFLFMTDFNLMDEDPLNPNELYCKVCDQYFNTIHNKKEHLSGRMHVRTVKRKLKDYYQPDPSSDPEPDPPEEPDKRGLNDLDDIRADIMDSHAQRELEIRSLKDDTMDNLMKNVQLTKELQDLRETYRKLQSDLKNLKLLECSLQAKLNGLRLLMTLFGVIHYTL